MSTAALNIMTIAVFNTKRAFFNTFFGYLKSTHYRPFVDLTC